jgi:hypothetical protein
MPTRQKFKCQQDRKTGQRPQVSEASLQETSNKSINKTPVVGLRDGKTAQQDSKFGLQTAKLPIFEKYKRISRQDNQQDSRKLSDKKKTVHRKKSGFMVEKLMVLRKDECV